MYSAGTAARHAHEFWREAEQELLEIAAARALRSLPWPGRGVVRPRSSRRR